MTFIFIWIFLVILHGLLRGYLTTIYFDLKPNELVECGYLRKTELWKYQDNFICLSNEKLKITERHLKSTNKINY